MKALRMAAFVATTHSTVFAFIVLQLRWYGLLGWLSMVMILWPWVFVLFVLLVLWLKNRRSSLPVNETE